MQGFEECYLMTNIPNRNLASGCHLLKKKLINLHGGLLDVTTNVHIPQIVRISSRFRVLNVLSWEFERSEVL